MAGTGGGRRKRWLIILGSSMLVWAIILFVTLAALWQKGMLQDYFATWFQKRVIDTQLAKLAPHLPFVIEKFEYRAPWADFKHGKITQLDMTLLWGTWRIYLSGPLDFTRNREDKEIEIKYLPIGSIEPASPVASRQKGARTSPVNLEIGAHIALPLNKLHEITFTASAGKFSWPMMGVQSEVIHLTAALDHPHEQNGQQAHVEFSAKSFNWSDEKATHAISVDHPQIQIATPLRLGPFSLGPLIDLSWTAKGSEILWGDFYTDLPLQAAPTKIRVTVSDANPLDVRDLAIAIGMGKVPDLSVNVTKTSKTLALSWKSSKLRLVDLLTFAGKQPKAAFLKDFDIKKGILSTSGTATAAWPIESTGFQKGLSWRARLALKEISFNWPKAAIAIKNLSLEIPSFSQSGIPKATLAAENVYFKHFQGILRPTVFSLMARGPYAGELEAPKGVDLEIKDLPLKIGEIHGLIGKSNDSLVTSLKVKSVSLSHLLQGFCFDPAKVAPGTFTLDMPEVDLRADSIEPTGSARVDLFDGFLEVRNLAIFDLLSEVIETNFDLKWNSIRLDQLGIWLGFGEMDGVFVGRANGVTFQSWLPTQYDFKAEVKPLHRSKVVFSPDAMKNVVKLFAGSEIDQLPGVANWLAFGWPSRIFGGYDVLYAGISAVSADGSILVSTLDPKNIFEREQKHFILYGPRFKMPLRSPHYPLIVDATAMGNFGRNLVQQLKNIAETKALKAAKKIEAQRLKDKGLTINSSKISDDFKETSHDADQKIDPCLPPVL